MPPPRPSRGEPVRAAMLAAAKADISILPSREISMMPERSENRPAIAHKISGVATRRVASIVSTNCSQRSVIIGSLLVCVTAVDPNNGRHEQISKRP